jgi:hypothetical protein
MGFPEIDIGSLSNGSKDRFDSMGKKSGNAYILANYSCDGRYPAHPSLPILFPRRSRLRTLRQLHFHYSSPHLSVDSHSFSVSMFINNNRAVSLARHSRDI